MPDAVKTIQNALFKRFGERITVDASLPGLDELAGIAAAVHIAAPRCVPTRISATRRASAARSSIAGRRTRRGNTRCHCALTLAPSFARRAFISTEAIL